LSDPLPPLGTNRTFPLILLQDKTIKRGVKLIEKSEGSFTAHCKEDKFTHCFENNDTAG
jgi:hypothetical protein